MLSNEFEHIRSVYFNTAYFGPSPLRARANAQAAIEKEMDPSYYEYAEWQMIPDRVRSKLANLIEAPADSIALHSSVGEAVSYVSMGYPFKEGDTVVAFDGDFPSNILPWMVNEAKRPYHFELLPQSLLSDPTELAKSLPSTTRVLDTSYVSFKSGELVDLESLGKLCKERDIFLMVDCSQALGGIQVLPQELQYIDVMMGACYKWLLGPYGTAFAYYSDRAISKVERTSVSWLASPKSRNSNNIVSYTAEPLPGARKFDRGQSPNPVQMALLEGSLDLLNELGLEKIEKHNRGLIGEFFSKYPSSKYEVLTDRERYGSIIGLRARGGVDSRELEKRLREKNIDISVREGNLRLSFHLFNSSNQVDLLVDALDF